MKKRTDGAHAKLGYQTWLKKCGQLGCRSRSKLSLTNSEIQVKSRIRESIFVLRGEIPFETWKLGSKFGNFLLYTHPLRGRKPSHIPVVTNTTGALSFRPAENRHINIRYFFVKDSIASLEVKIEHCPTQEMMANFFTKPLQRAPFGRMQDAIMNANPQFLDNTYKDCRSVLNMNHNHL